MGAPQALTLSRLLGNSIMPLQQSHQLPLFYRNLQHCLQASLVEGEQEYPTPVHLAPEAMEGLNWWHQLLTRWNGRCLLSQKPTLTIETCLHHRMGSNVSESLNLRFLVKDREADGHQLPTVTCTGGNVSMLCKGPTQHTGPPEDGQHDCPPYINQLGGTVSPPRAESSDERTVALVPRQEHNPASHSPAGVLNGTADEESRVMKDRTDWRLCPQIFDRLTGPLQVDLFASYLTYQLQDYVSWRVCGHSLDSLSSGRNTSMTP